MRNVRIYSFSISKEVVEQLDRIVDECNKKGVNVTRSKVVNTLLDSETLGRTYKTWVNYFVAEHEYKEKEMDVRKYAR